MIYSLNLMAMPSIPSRKGTLNSDVRRNSMEKVRLPFWEGPGVDLLPTFFIFFTKPKTTLAFV